MKTKWNVMTYALTLAIASHNVWAAGADTKGNGDFDAMRVEEIITDLGLDRARSPEEAMELLVEALNQPIEVNPILLPTDTQVFAPGPKDEGVKLRFRQALGDQIKLISQQIMELRTFVATMEARLHAKETMPMAQLNRKELKAARKTIENDVRVYQKEVDYKVYVLLGAVFFQKSVREYVDPGRSERGYWSTSDETLDLEMSKCSIYCQMSTFLPTLRVYFSAMEKILEPFNLHSIYLRGSSLVRNRFEALLAAPQPSGLIAHQRIPFGNGTCAKQYRNWQIASFLSVAGIPLTIAMEASKHGDSYKEARGLKAFFCSFNAELEAEYQEYAAQVSAVKAQAYLKTFDKMNGN